MLPSIKIQNGGENVFFCLMTIMFKKITLIEFFNANDAKDENSKWRPNSIWTSTHFYRLKLVYLILFEIS
jgi:hypothetical protein